LLIEEEKRERHGRLNAMENIRMALRGTIQSYSSREKGRISLEVFYHSFLSLYSPYQFVEKYPHEVMDIAYMRGYGGHGC
jgi:hypothetical protein